MDDLFEIINITYSFTFIYSQLKINIYSFGIIEIIENDISSFSITSDIAKKYLEYEIDMRKFSKQRSNKNKKIIENIPKKLEFTLNYMPKEGCSLESVKNEIKTLFDEYKISYKIDDDAFTIYTKTYTFTLNEETIKLRLEIYFEDLLINLNIHDNRYAQVNNVIINNGNIILFCTFRIIILSYLHIYELIMYIYNISISSFNVELLNTLQIGEKCHLEFYSYGIIQLVNNDTKIICTTKSMLNYVKWHFKKLAQHICTIDSIKIPEKCIDPGLLLKHKVKFSIINDTHYTLSETLSTLMPNMDIIKNFIKFHNIDKNEIIPFVDKHLFHLLITKSKHIITTSLLFIYKTTTDALL